MLADGASGSRLPRIGWVVAGIGPPFIAAGTWRHLVADHPVLAGVIFVGYEAALAVVAFAGEIAGELRRRWRDRMVDHVDQALGRWTSQFGRRYRECVLATLRFIDQKGLATIGYYTPELDEVFVDVSLARRAPHLVPGDVLADMPAEVTERRSIWDFLDHPEGAVLAVVGAPGSGKTTLLRHTAHKVCRAGKGRRRTVPILLYLRDHVADIVSSADTTLPEVVRRMLAEQHVEEPAGWFDQRLRDGDCLVLFDGLDEVAGQEDRRTVADWVERQVSQYQKNDFVVTSRPHGYRSATVAGATVLQVRRFTDEQVTRFVCGWYRAVERHSIGEDSEEVRRRADSAANDLLDRLRHAPGLYDLTANPLLLTMIANVHRYRGALPGSRPDLYGEICQVMLWRRQEAKKLLSTEIGGNKKELILRALAFTMMRKRVRDLSRAEVINAVNPALRRLSKQLTAEDFLSDVESNGLLIERESRVFSFAHHTFQEYLAAAHISDRGLTKVLTSAVDDVWWRETILLYAARSDADPIIRACLAVNSVSALALAFDCAAQDSELTGGEPTFRLPTGAELDDPAVHHAVAWAAEQSAGSAWVGSAGQGGNPQLWTQVSDAHPYAVPASVLAEHVANDIERSGATLARLLLLRSTILLRDLLLARDLLVHRLFIDGELARALDLAGALDQDIGLADDLVLARVLARDLARARANARDRARSLDIARTLALDLARTLDRRGDRLGDLDRALAVDRALGRARTVDLDRDSVLSLAMGRALGRTLSRVVQQSVTGGQATLAKIFLDETGVAGVDHIVPLDALAGHLQPGGGVFSARIPSASEGSLLWAGEVESRLVAIAVPIFRRQTPLTPETAAAIRMPALCLAAEADIRSMTGIGDKFRELAAGVTLIERRLDGRAPVTETILLAVA
jgi:hypothetical protein